MGVRMDVSVVLTVKNEGAGLRPLLDSLLAQSRLPDEVIVSDGGSTDGTLRILEEYERRLPLRVVDASGSNISAGRNRAIAAAEGPLIAVTDGGVVLGTSWLAELVRPLEEDGAQVVSGWFEADPYSDFEVVMGATVMPDRREIDPQRFLPSSRSVAFRKEAWAAVGGYPEWLDFGEDLVFDLALRKLYGPFPFAGNAVAYYRPRGSLKAFARQYYNYAQGDGQANLWPKRHAVRYATYLLLLPFLLRLIRRGQWAGWAGLIGGGGLYVARPVRRLLRATTGWPAAARLRALALVPAIMAVGDVAKMVGYAAGWWETINRR